MKEYNGYLKIWRPGQAMPVRFEGMVNRIDNPLVEAEDMMVFEVRSNHPEAKTSIVSIPSHKFMVQYYEDHDLND